MVVRSNAFDKIGGNGARAFQCASCSGLITHSDRLLLIGGKTRHFFVNPMGVECDFYTFASCPGALALGEATDEHTWFSGYAWRMAFCQHCSHHLGWHYEGTMRSRRPSDFWGILVSSLVSI
jgi:hypothetical protein